MSFYDRIDHNKWYLKIQKVLSENNCTEIFFVVFPDGGQGSPATLTGPPGSNTPQYTASPAPSGSSTPGPAPPQGPNFPGAPPNSTTPQYNGPNQSGPFGSPGENK